MLEAGRVDERILLHGDTKIRRTQAVPEFMRPGIIRFKAKFRGRIGEIDEIWNRDKLPPETVM